MDVSRLATREDQASSGQEVVQQAVATGWGWDGGGHFPSSLIFPSSCAAGAGLIGKTCV